jgi:hypothetical protein
MVLVTVALSVPDLVLPSVITALQSIRELGDTFSRVLLIAGAILFDGIMILLIGLELWPRRRRTVRVQQATGGMVQLDMSSIADRLAYHIDQMQDVISAKPAIRARRNGVDVAIQVTTAPEVDVPAKAQEIIERTQSVMTEKMGLKLAGPPRVEVRIAPYPKAAKPATADQRRL